MKEKNKKILKGVGVGALALVGMVGLTGCADVKISQEKFNSLVEIAEKADDYMKESARLTKEEVWNLAQTADFNLMMNVNGVRDNLVISASMTDGSAIDVAMVYYNTDTMKVFTESFEGSSIELWYQTTESNVILADIEKVENGYICERFEERDETFTFEGCIGVYRGGIPAINTWELTFEDFNHYEFLENGNVKLTFVKNVEYKNPDNQEEYFITLEDYSFEYSLDGKLVSLKMSSRIIEKEGEFENRIDMVEKYTYNMEYKLRYGEIDTELVESWVEIAEAKRNEQ
ncbi:MAG: hypothetical protein J6Q13_03295 [Clostridia bacterium]|nr:hypothetical protein [Clostridia bacterium]